MIPITLNQVRFIRFNAKFKLIKIIKTINDYLISLKKLLKIL